MLQNKKILPVGVESFEKMIQQNYYYIDKTDFIRQLLQWRGEVNLFTRPRRFGKSLMINMLKSFFEIGSDASLFDGLAITKEIELYKEYQGKYPVVFLSLKSINRKTYEKSLAKLADLIADECKRFPFLLENPTIDPDDKQKFQRLKSEIANEIDLQSALKLLMRMLHMHYNQRVVLLIDEYDVPLDKANEYSYYEEMIDFLRNFFGDALKGNPDLEFAILTGCLRISKESIFTGLNNLKVYTISDVRYNEYFGFTDADVKQLLTDYGLSNAYSSIKEWYDGYHFGDLDIYCPWDVLNYCDELLTFPNKKPDVYWINTSSNSIIRQFIDKANHSTQADIEDLIAGKSICKQITDNLTYGELDDDIDHLWSMLYLTGYLTVDRTTSQTEDGSLYLSIPNNGIRKVFIQQIQKWFKETIGKNKESINALTSAFIAGDAETVQRLLEEQLRTTISYYDTYESFYHGFLLGLLSQQERWEPRSNQESGDGRSDIQIRLPGDSTNAGVGILIELKRAKTREELLSQCEAAITQIREKRYAESMRDDGLSSIWCYGIAFYRKSCHVLVKKASEL